MATRSQKWQAGPTEVSDPESNDEALESLFGPIPKTMPLFRIAMHAADPIHLVDVITGVDLDDALQQVGSGLLRTQLGASPRNRQVLAPCLAILGEAPHPRPYLLILKS